MRLVIVTGMSGAGKSTTMKMLEDMGFFCVDNLPVPLLPNLVDFSNEFYQNVEKVAVGVDVRSGKAIADLMPVAKAFREQGGDLSILFLDASDEVLVKRYKETRRNHPLAMNERVEMAIAEERSQLRMLREQADYIIDTSHLLTRELKTELQNIFMNQEDYKNLYVTILSFGFKYGIPSDSDMVMDVRFLPNPYYVEELRPKTGNDKEIRDYVLGCEEAQVFLDKMEDLIDFLIPNYISEGKNQLVISIGCTGGKHRSVTLANEIYKRLSENKTYGLKIEHRDIAKDAIRGK
ncbi:RNase adapter RapZ [Agathobacter ruminis]|uniref:RNase adapter RapZ n=1 Tax=Agathobacter ruminis TaxID=1712665 RepID=A0A2G3E258_9FIRM|nr:RNase adapter RapZ [Agathobacter ruminis]MDC7301963.1 RNase adapter RapZ [Agathobacter ruminis]PHU37193.1 RNase adapter RapZ [Agathobacter ruminis]